MPLFFQKLGVIEAFRLGEKGHPTPAPSWFGSPDPSRISTDGILIPTPKGDLLARWGDWIIRDTGGQFRLCKPDVFAATYELVHEER